MYYEGDKVLVDSYLTGNTGIIPSEVGDAGTNLSKVFVSSINNYDSDAAQITLLDLVQ